MMSAAVYWTGTPPVLCSTPIPSSASLPQATRKGQISVSSTATASSSASSCEEAMSRVVGDEYLVTVVLGCINNGVDSCRASHVCKKWRQLCDEDFYKEKCKEKFSGKTTGVYSSWKHMFVDGNKKNLSSRVRSLNRCARVDCAWCARNSCAVAHSSTSFVPVDSAIGSIGNMHSVQYAGVFHSMALACTRLRAMLSSY